MSLHRSPRSGGFSLPELLTVVVIIGILAALAIPRLTSQKGSAYLAAARSDAYATALNVESMLTELVLPGAGAVKYDGAGHVQIWLDGIGLAAQADANLTEGSSLPQQSGGNGNNRIAGTGDYCLAVSNNGQTAYYTRRGLMNTCMPDGITLTSQGGGQVNSIGGGAVVIAKTFLSPFQTTPAPDWAAVAIGAGKAVAAGSLSGTGYLAHSPTGLPGSWTVTTPFPDASAITGLAYGNGQFVAIGSDRIYHTDDPTDGTWTEASVTFPVASADWSLVYGGGKFIAIGAGKYLASEDGITWTSGVAGGSVNKVAYASGKFLAIQSGTRTAYKSADGTAWSAASALRDPGAGQWLNVSAANGLFFVTGDNTTTANVIMSADATTWDVPTLPGGAVTVWAFASGGNGATYLMPASGTSAVKSLDSGSTWVLHGLVSAKPWRAGTSDSSGVVTVVGADGWTMSST